MKYSMKTEGRIRNFAAFTQKFYLKFHRISIANKLERAFERIENSCSKN